ncbi:pyridoxamine 5'-phosphate oxidase family protein [Roseomonas sp. NAR14]|uniref:Pyridoxamine 5'-phosphate oxidase family protein n=1 Tax=Roseomonas acroporae TaxID=2937791 RepID=A0A9X2BV80_9PROT|nr:pyridoxamine 5'-phosphate oxidase family protein [Roseomonas acroporae]MCK8784811.1 pyridoxamine 5'-phosphate oxidase family protein [Roseomonas acroporae]
MPETRSDSDAKAKVWEMIRDVKVAVLVTNGADGHLHGRPMVAVQDEPFNDTLWFFTPAEGGVADEIGSDPQLLLSYSNPSSQDYVSVAGKGEIVRDAAMQKKLWSEGMRTWFPKGAEDPGLALLKVTVEGAEYWDAPSSTMVYAYGYLKARLTGEPPHPGEVAKVDFRR